MSRLLFAALIFTALLIRALPAPAKPTPKAPAAPLDLTGTWHAYHYAAQAHSYEVEVYRDSDGELVARWLNSDGNLHYLGTLHPATWRVSGRAVNGWIEAYDPDVSGPACAAFCWRLDPLENGEPRLVSGTWALVRPKATD